MEKSVMVFVAANAYQNAFWSMHRLFLMDLSQDAVTGMHWRMVAKIVAVAQQVIIARKA